MILGPKCSLQSAMSQTFGGNALSSQVIPDCYYLHLYFAVYSKKQLLHHVIINYVWYYRRIKDDVDYVAQSCEPIPLLRYYVALLYWTLFGFIIHALELLARLLNYKWKSHLKLLILNSAGRRAYMYSRKSGCTERSNIWSFSIF